MSRGFWIAMTCVFAAFAGYETVLNAFLRELHTTAVRACVRVEPSAAPHIEASYEL